MKNQDEGRTIVVAIQVHLKSITSFLKEKTINERKNTHFTIKLYHFQKQTYKILLQTNIE